MKREWKKGYKVVKEENGKYYSAVVTEFHARQLYRLKKSTGERYWYDGPLAVFETYKDAVNFVQKLGSSVSLKIFRVKYTRSLKRQLYHTFLTILKEYYSNGEWGQRYEMSRTYIHSLPKGTDFADEVILKKEVTK